MDDDFTDYEVLHNYYEDEEEFASPTPSPFPEPVANSWEVSQVQEKDQRSFPEEKTELLIETIKKYPSLWNIKDKNYRNRVERNSDWTKVLVEIGLTHNHKECTRKRWDSIKTNYTRSKNIPSGSGAQKKYRHAILLAFLDDTQTPRATKTVMNEGRVSKVVKGKKNSSNQVQQKLQSEAISLLKEINKPREEKTYATLTCELVRQDMESLPDSEQRALRKELFELVDRFVARNREQGAD